MVVGVYASHHPAIINRVSLVSNTPRSRTDPSKQSCRAHIVWRLVCMPRTTLLHPKMAGPTCQSKAAQHKLFGPWCLYITPGAVCPVSRLQNRHSTAVSSHSLTILICNLRTTPAAAEWVAMIKIDRSQIKCRRVK